MWCGKCRQNVKGVVSAGGDGICCSRCATAFPGGAAPSSSVEDPSREVASTELHFHPSSTPVPKPHVVEVPLPDANSKAPSNLAAALESWEIDEDLRHIERRLKTFAGAPADAAGGEASPRLG